MKRRKFIQAGTATVLAAGMAFTAVAPAHALDKLKVAINNTTVGSQAGQFIAQAKGYFAEEGLEVEFLILDNGPLVVAAVLSGEADMASGGANASFYNSAAKGDLRMLAATVGEKAGFHNAAFFVNPKVYESGVREIKDLGGKRIGMTALGVGFHYSLLAAGKKYGFPVDTSTVVPLGSPANVKAAVQSGSVDGAVYSGSVAVAMEQAGDAKIIGWAGDVAEFSGSAIYTSQKALAEKRPLLVKFLRANLKGTADYAKAFQSDRDADGKFKPNPLADELIGILAKEIKLKPDQVAAALPYIRVDGKITNDELAEQIAIWQAAGMVDAAADASQLLDASVLEDASK